MRRHESSLSFPHSHSSAQQRKLSKPPQVAIWGSKELKKAGIKKKKGKVETRKQVKVLGEKIRANYREKSKETVKR